MLNPFPIQFLALLSYFILRLFLAGILLYLGINHLRHRHELKKVLKLACWPYGYFTTITFATGEIILSLLILTGAFTQYACLAIIAMSLKMIILKKYFNHFTIPPRIFYILLLGTSLTLFITGAGVFAFDLPL